MDTFITLETISEPTAEDHASKTTSQTITAASEFTSEDIDYFADYERSGQKSIFAMCTIA
jgi:hypothetical protein